MAITFEEWMKKVDESLKGKCFLTHMDLADAPYHDMWESGYTPDEAADESLVEHNDYPEDLIGDE